MIPLYNTDRAGHRFESLVFEGFPVWQRPFSAIGKPNAAGDHVLTPLHPQSGLLSTNGKHCRACHSRVPVLVLSGHFRHGMK